MKRRWIGRASGASGLDAVVMSALTFRMWQAFAGFATILFVARYLSPELQGCYYTFGSLLALQGLSDLGLFIVVSTSAAREYAHLSWNGASLSGHVDALSRLHSLGQQLLLWYGGIAALSGVVIGAAGYSFLSATVPLSVEWRAPWMAVIAASTIGLWLSPMLAILEGCGQLAALNRYRLWFGIVSSAAAWIAMALGLGLWALPAAGGVIAARDLLLLTTKYRKFSLQLILARSGATVHWWMEIWPMQWRLALQGLSQFAASQLFTPILMYYHGPIAAGRYGMTWSLVTGLQTVTLSWIHARQPALALLAARGERVAFDQVWRRAAQASVASLAGGGALLCIGIAVLSRMGIADERLLPVGAAALLVVGVCCAQVVQALAAYVRAHRREEMMPAGVSYSIAAAVLGWALGRAFGAGGAALAYTIAMGAVALPIAAFVWSGFRRRRGAA